MKTKLILLSTLVMVMFNCNMQTSKNIRVIDAQEFKKEISNKKVQLIDVRSAAEFAQSSIPNAINIDVSNNDFKQKIKTLNPSKPVYVYCTKGYRSNKAAQILEKAGFKQIIDLKGGFENWN